MSVSYWVLPGAEKPYAVGEVVADIQTKLVELGFDEINGSTKVFIDPITRLPKMISLYEPELQQYKLAQGEVPNFIERIPLVSTEVEGWVDRILDAVKAYNQAKDLLSQLPRRVKAQCAILRPGAIPPIRKRPTDAGYDIISDINLTLPPRGNVDVSTGIALAVQRGFYYTVEGRSGLGTKFRVVPFTGTIDACYIGELYVMLTNNSDEEFFISKGDRIAQLIVKEQLDLEIEIVEEFSDEYKSRGTAGFGSSGR